MLSPIAQLLDCRTLFIHVYVIKYWFGNQSVLFGHLTSYNCVTIFENGLNDQEHHFDDKIIETVTW